MFSAHVNTVLSPIAFCHEKRGKIMDENLLKFINKDTNYAEVKVSLGREKTQSGKEYVIISYGGQKLYSFWNNPNKEIKIKDGEEKPPKHTGGKKPYVMLMIEDLRKLRSEGLSNEVIGYMVCLSENVEWSTGRLIHKRSKKSLLYKDLLALYQTDNNRKLNQILAIMKEHNLLTSTAEGYFLSPKIIRKGKAPSN